MNSTHDWKKQNFLGRLYRKGRHYDVFVCANCGAKGKRFDGEIEMDTSSLRIKAHRECVSLNQRADGDRLLTG